MKKCKKKIIRFILRFELFGSLFGLIIDYFNNKIYIKNCHYCTIKSIFSHILKSVSSIKLIIINV